jgi:hypothetical protein
VDIALQTEKSKKLNSERLARNPVFLARPQTFGLHQILRHVSSSEFSELEKYFEKADFTDVKVFEGETTLRKFIASMLCRNQGIKALQSYLLIGLCSGQKIRDTGSRI